MSSTLTAQLKKQSQQIPAPAPHQESEHRSMPPQSAGHSTPAAGGHALSRMQLHSDTLAAPTAQSCSKGYTKPSHCPFGGACHTCPSVVQAKLTVGQPGDKYEEEADRTADRIMRMAAPGGDDEPSDVSTAQIPTIQRSCPACEDEEIRRQPIDEAEVEDEGGEDDILQAKQASGGGLAVSPALQAQIGSMRGGGQPLPGFVRSFFEPRFGYDLSGVRLHMDSTAHETTRAVRARAFTLRNNIVLGGSESDLSSSRGMGLLAHELTHVIQQGAARPMGGTHGRRSAASQIRRLVQRDTIQRAVRATCAAQMTAAGNGSVCKPPPNAAVAGTKIHAEIARMFRSESSDHVTEVPIPAAAKSAAYGESGPVVPAGIPVVGKADLVKVLRRTGSEVVIQIGEIKPMTWVWFAAGEGELKYYKGKIEEASDECIRYKQEFLDGLERRLAGLPPDAAAATRKKSMQAAAKSLASHMFCMKLGAVGKKVRLASPYGLTWRSRTFSMNLGGIPRTIRVMTCDDGIISYRCVEKPDRKKKPKKQRPRDKGREPARKGAKSAEKRAERAAERRAEKAGAGAAEKRAAKELAKRQARAAARAAEKQVERQLGKKVASKLARKAIVKLAARVAAKVALKMIPVVGWVLLAIDVAEAAYGLYQLAKYGPGSGGGGNGPTEGNAESGVEGPAGEGPVGEEADGETGDAEGQELDEELKQMGIFNSPEEAEEYAQSLPLSKETLEALKQTTPEQQRMLELMLDYVREQGRPQVSEQFFMQIIEMTKGLTAEELEKLEGMLVPVRGETLDDILGKLRKGLETIRQEKTGGGGDEADTETGKGGSGQGKGSGPKGKQGGGALDQGRVGGTKGTLTEGGSGGEAKSGGGAADTTGDRDAGEKSGGGGQDQAGGPGADAKGDKAGAGPAPSATQKGTGPAPGAKAGEGKPGAKYHQAERPPADAKRAKTGTFRFIILSGMQSSGDYTSGRTYDCTIRAYDQTGSFVVTGVKITYQGRTDTEETVGGKTVVTTHFRLYIAEDFYVKDRDFYGRSGVEEDGSITSTDYDFGRHLKQ